MSAAAEFPRTPPDSKRELRALFEHAMFGLAELRRSGQMLALNPAFEQMLGIGSGATGPVSFRELIPAEKRADGDRLFRELLAGERDSFRLECGETAGSRRPSRWTAWRVAGKTGQTDSVLAVAENNRDWALERRGRDAERLEAVGRLAGGVAHDFNNLLTGVLLYCDLLLANLEPNHRVRKYAEEIRRAGMQATGLVRQILAVARPRSSEPRLLSLNEIADGMQNLLTRLIGENIELRFLLDPDLGLIKMDPTQAQQILLNLVLNSRDAMPDGGTITVETRNCQVQGLAENGAGTSAPTIPCAWFVVSDTGSGMDEATRAHVFEAFFTTKGKGTGLGLATVHEIVTSNGGLIHVESASGRGTRVTVLLPLVPAGVVNSQSAQRSDQARPKTEGALSVNQEEQTP